MSFFGQHIVKFMGTIPDEDRQPLYWYVLGKVSTYADARLADLADERKAEELLSTCREEIQDNWVEE